MPELPEVETIKNGLTKSIVGKNITDINFLWPGILRNSTIKEFRTKVIDQKIMTVERRAKNIDISLANGYSLLFHMKMTGHLILANGKIKIGDDGKWIFGKNYMGPLSDPFNQYIRVVFWLSDGNIVAFSDLRKFAYIKLLAKNELDKFYSGYGPEPLSREFSLIYLKNILVGKRVAIKKLLIDQRQIAGIGNIYADEILWEARIHPLMISANLDDKMITKLHIAIIKILKEAVKLKGTSTSDYRDISGAKGKYGDALKVYRRTGEPCPRDNAKIERVKIGGRSSHFCPKCQKL